MGSKQQQFDERPVQQREPAAAEMPPVNAQLNSPRLRCSAGHKHESYKLDCCLTPSDAHVISGSEDGDLLSTLVHPKLRASATAHTRARPWLCPCCRLTSNLFCTLVGQTWKLAGGCYLLRCSQRHSDILASQGKSSTGTWWRRTSQSRSWHTAAL